jgi:excisionase family DNA binding protein
MTRDETPTINANAIYTPDEVAMILSCSRTHVYRLINSRAIPFVDISAPSSKMNKARIKGSDLEAYLRANTTLAAVK